MRRHPTDLVGLIFGTAFAIAGVAFLVNEVTDTNVNPAWATGLGLMLLGAVALIATVVRGLGAHDDDHAHGYAPGYEHDHAFPYGDAVVGAYTSGPVGAPEAEGPTAEATTSEG